MVLSVSRMLLVVSVVIVMTSSCGAVKVKDEREARLMPQVVAIKILNKYFGQAWVNNPVGYAMPRDTCGEDYKSFPINKITHMGVLFENKTIVLQTDIGLSAMLSAITGSCEERQVHFTYSSPISYEDTNDILDALVSLGADLDRVN